MTLTFTCRKVEQCVGILQFTVILQLVDLFIHLSKNKYMYILLRSSALLYVDEDYSKS